MVSYIYSAAADRANIAFQFENLSMTNATLANFDNLGAVDSTAFPFGNPDGFGLVTSTSTNPTVITSTKNPVDPKHYSNALNRTINKVSREEQNFAKQKTVQLKEFVSSIKENRNNHGVLSPNVYGRIFKEKKIICSIC